MTDSALTNSEAATAAAPDSSSTAGLHPLQHHWTMWYYTPKRQPGKADATWEEGLVQVHTVKSVEEFWAVANTIKKPSAMEQGAVYSFFKSGIKPMWEDPSNKAGGKWTISLTQASDLYRLDSIWEEVLMACIGEYLDEVSAQCDEITGVMLAKKRNLAKLSLWTKGRDDLGMARRLGERLRDVMGLDAGSGAAEFLAHGVESHDPLIKL